MISGPATEAKIKSVTETMAQHGKDSLIVLSGVAGTGKTHISLAAAHRHGGHELFVKQIQFHQAYSYEDFIEGFRPTTTGGFEIRNGMFLEWNKQALSDPHNSYTLLIEEFTRANIVAVIGELMTYIEHRNRVFELPISRKRIQVAPNLTILVTMNPRDRSALEVDDALIRRLRIIDCPPDIMQLEEMLKTSLPNGDEQASIIASLKRIFIECEKKHPDTYRELMPFGHGIFAGVRNTHDLHQMWEQRIKHLLRRPLVMPHPFCDTIESFYPWKSSPTVESSPS